MTTIAWDGKTLAADRCMTANGMRVEYKKLSVHPAPKSSFPPGAYAGAGQAAFTESVRAWIDSGGPLPERDKDESPDWGCGLYVTNSGQCHIVTQRMVLLPAQSLPVVAGSGGQFAAGCMVAGWDAVRAVEAAERHADGSGLGVDTWTPTGHAAP